MSKVQTNLHKFFKAKRNYGDLAAKNKLPIINETLQSNNFLCVTPSKKVTEERSNLLITNVEPLKDGLDAAVSTSTSDCSTTLSTPRSEKRKNASENFPERKRKRVTEEESEAHKEDCLTPTKIIRLNTLEKSSVKKKIFDNDCREETIQGKLSPQQIKEKLGKCSRLNELRACLLKLNNCDQKLKEFRSASLLKTPEKKEVKSPQKLKTPRRALFVDNGNEKTCVPPSPHKLAKIHPQLEHFRAFDVDVPLSPSKSPLKISSPLKSSSPRKPCYQRFSHLVSEAPLDELVLPYKYQVVKEIFRAADTVISLLHNREEVITYSKLKPSIEKMIRKAFSECHLGQIKTVFPLAYFFNQEKLKKKFADERSTYELTVSVNMNYKESSEVLPSDKPKLKFRKMDSVILVDRRQIFHESLLQILRRKHQEFLESLDPPIVLCGPLKRWHPEFNIEDVEEPDVSPLPQPPQQTIYSAKDLLEKGRDIFSTNNRMKNALETAVVSNHKETASETSSNTNSEISCALKGVSLSLLEKIRAKEALNAAKVMMRSSSENEEIEMLSRLPKMVDIIRHLFRAEKKNALSWDFVANHLSSAEGMQISKVNCHLHTLIKEVPGWCTVHKVRSGTFLKIDKMKDRNEIERVLAKALQKKS